MSVYPDTTIPLQIRLIRMWLHWEEIILNCAELYLLALLLAIECELQWTPDNPDA